MRRRCYTDAPPWFYRCATVDRSYSGVIPLRCRCAADALPMCYRCDTEVSPKRRRGRGHVTNLYKYGPLLENLTIPALDAELTTVTFRPCHPRRRDLLLRHLLRRRRIRLPSLTRADVVARRLHQHPQAPAPLADAAADEPAPRSPTPHHDSSREPAPGSRSSSVDSQASAGSNAIVASNAASVTSTAASTSTVASVSSKAKGKAVTKKNTSSLTLPEENQMVDWLEDNPIMWNTLMMKYKCQDKKKKLWEDQAALMGKSYQTIFTWYTSARDTHTKLLKTKSGSGAQRLTGRESWLLERFQFRKVVQRTKAAPMKSVSILQF